MTLPVMPTGYRWFRGGPGLSRAGRNALFAADDTTVWVWDEETGNPVTDLLDETATPISAPKVVDGWVLGAGLPNAVRVASFSLGKDGKRYGLEPAANSGLYAAAAATSATDAQAAQAAAESARDDAVTAKDDAISATANKVDKGSIVVNVKDYGAKGDGTTDDRAAIQNAITATGWPANRAKIVFPAGTYNVSAAIQVNGGGATSTPHLVLEGHGATLTTTVASSTILNITNSVISLTRVHVVGLFFKPNASGAIGAILNNAELCTFQRCGFLGSFATGVKITGVSTYSTFTACEFGNLARGIELAGDASYLTVTGCQFNEQLVGSPLDWIGATVATTQVGVKIRSNTFYGTGATREVVYLSNASACTIGGNTFDRSPLGAIFLGTGGSADNNNISGNTFIRTKNGSDVRIRGGNRCIVSNNTFGVHDSGTTTGTYSNVQVQDPFTTNQGSGCVVMGNTSASTATELHSMVRFDATCKNNVVIGNVGRAAIVAADASNVVANNIAA